MPQSHPAPPKGKPGTIAASPQTEDQLEVPKLSLRHPVGTTGQAVETAGIDKPDSWRPSLSGPETATAYSKHAE